MRGADRIRIGKRDLGISWFGEERIWSGTRSDTVTAEWSTTNGRNNDVVLTLNSLDDIPAEVTTVIAIKQLADAEFRPIRVGGALSKFLGDRGRIRARRFDQILAELPD